MRRRLALVNDFMCPLCHTPLQEVSGELRCPKYPAKCEYKSVPVEKTKSVWNEGVG